MTFGNNRFKQLRVLWEVHFCVPQNFLSLTEKNSLRSSQMLEAAERQAVKKLFFLLNNLLSQSNSYVIRQAEF